MIETIKLIPVDETSPDNSVLSSSDSSPLVSLATQFWVQCDKAEQHYQVNPHHDRHGEERALLGTLICCINCVWEVLMCVWRYVGV